MLQTSSIRHSFMLRRGGLDLTHLSLLAILAAGVSTVSSISAFAQGGPGLTESQAITFSAIEAHCAKTREILSSLSEQERAWSDSCWALVTSNNAINNTGGPTGASIDEISNDKKLGWAVQQSSQSKVLTQVRGAVESANNQFSNIGTRLEMVRLGVGGLSLAGINVENKPLLAYQLPSSGISGGGASSDYADPSNLGVFLNGNFVFGDREKSDRQEGFDFENQDFTTGIDFRFSDAFVMGLAAGYANSEVDIDASGGDLETESTSVSTFGSYYTDNFHFDTIFSYAWNDYSSIRNIVYPTVNTQARGDTEGEQYSIGITAGYDVNLGAITFGPHGRAEYVKAEVDGYEEKGSAGGHDLTLRDQEIESLASTLGIHLSSAMSSSLGVFQPQLSMEWQHEFENQSRGVSAKYTYDPFNTWFALPTDTPDKDYYTVSVGVSGTFARGVSAFINYETLLGLSKVDSQLIGAGIRLEF